MNSPLPSSPWSLTLAFEMTAGPLLAPRAPFHAGSLVFAIWLRGVRMPGIATGVGGTVLQRPGLPGRHAATGAAVPTGEFAAAASVRDVVLPLEALDALAVRLRATGLPGRTPSVTARVDTSETWIAHQLTVTWDDLPPAHLVLHTGVVGYEGPDAPAVEALFDHLVALGRGAPAR